MMRQFKSGSPGWPRALRLDHQHVIARRYVQERLGKSHDFGSWAKKLEICFPDILCYKQGEPRDLVLRGRSLIPEQPQERLGLYWRELRQYAQEIGLAEYYWCQIGLHMMLLPDKLGFRERRDVMLAQMVNISVDVAPDLGWQDFKSQILKKARMQWERLGRAEPRGQERRNLERDAEWFYRRVVEHQKTQQIVDDWPIEADPIDQAMVDHAVERMRKVLLRRNPNIAVQLVADDEIVIIKPVP